jgi:DNA-binding transcriptional MerR regulator
MSSYSLADLCDLADVTPRTVRYYIAQGLLRPPAGAGPATRYDDGHLDRLRLIRRLQKEHLPLSEIRRRLAALSDPEIAELAEPAPPTDAAADYIARVLSSRGVVPATGRPTSPQARRSSSPGPGALRALEPESPPLASPTMSGSAPSRGPGPAPRSTWERVALTPDIELHIRRPLSRDQNRRVDRLLETARAILEEDEPWT